MKKSLHICLLTGLIFFCNGLVPCFAMGGRPLLEAKAQIAEQVKVADNKGIFTLAHFVTLP